MSKPLTDKIKSERLSGYFKNDGTLIETSLTYIEIKRIADGLIGEKISTRANTKTEIYEVFSNYLSTRIKNRPSSRRVVKFDDIISADQTNIRFHKIGRYPVSSTKDPMECDYSLNYNSSARLSNNSYAPRIAELIRRTVKINKINRS